MTATGAWLLVTARISFATIFEARNEGTGQLVSPKYERRTYQYQGRDRR